MKPLTTRFLKPLIGVFLLLFGLQQPGNSQSIQTATDGTGSVVIQNGDHYDISGGTLSGDGQNLFHSFQEFGLQSGEIANFQSQTTIQNILSRVVGGNPSYIQGLIQVTGGNSHLFLMNPAGIVFGANARLDVPGSFAATTTNGIGFNGGWFNAIGENSYADLVGKPGGFAFLMAQPGAILNAGELAVSAGQNLQLVAGTVINTGKLSAPNGQVLVMAVPGETMIRVSQPGSVLSLEIPSPHDWPENLEGSIASVPQLLTGGGGENASQIAVQADGSLQLKGSGLTVKAGDIAMAEAQVESAQLLMLSQGNVALTESDLYSNQAMTIIAKDTVQIRDSEQRPVSLRSDGNLYIQGNQLIDIYALQHPEAPPALISGGSIILVSDGLVAADASFQSAGSFHVLNLVGQPGNFGSLPRYSEPAPDPALDNSFEDSEGALLPSENSQEFSEPLETRE